MALIFAHRGASKRAPENTLEAFLLAQELGADWVEFDVRRTADGVLVVHHDAYLADERALCDVSSSDLPSSIPSLAEALEVCQEIGVNVEIKNDPSEPGFDPEIAFSILGVTSAYVEPEKLLISSFHFDTLSNIKSHDPKIQTGLLFFDSLSAFQNIERAVEGGHSAIHPHLSCVNSALVQKAHSEGLKLNVWTVDESEQILNMLELGVDGIITDVPDTARSVLEEFEAKKQKSDKED